MSMTALKQAIRILNDAYQMDCRDDLIQQEAFIELAENERKHREAQKL